MPHSKIIPAPSFNGQRNHIRGGNYAYPFMYVFDSTLYSSFPSFDKGHERSRHSEVNGS
jgi:hypothetical protein